MSQGIHPHGSGASVLQHLLGDRATVPGDFGVFLDRTCADTVVVRPDPAPAAV